TGGSGGAGGGSGGVSGQGGMPGTGGKTGTTCADLQTAYAAALARAKSCSPNGSNQCQDTAPSSLDCGCETFVNDKTMVDQIQSSWNQAGCQNMTSLCPAIACVRPKSGSCRPADGGGSSCVDVLVSP
ncbi:MAG TPA: hypothetical protein VLT58_10260, partial [Polyangia bacterium]|nr:hypothetical protein [Polyangia bacterium]